MNIAQQAWTQKRRKFTPFPAQIKVRYLKELVDTSEKKFRHILEEFRRGETIKAQKLSKEQAISMIACMVKKPTEETRDASRPKTLAIKLTGAAGFNGKHRQTHH